MVQERKEHLLRAGKTSMIILFLAVVGVISVGGLTSDALDDLCATNTDLLQRSSGIWQCFKKSHASMYNYSANDTAWTFTIATANVYYNLTGLSNKSMIGFNYTTDTENGSILTLENGADGYYAIDWTMSYAPTGGDALYAVTAVKNGDVTISRDCYSRRWARRDQVGNVGGSCFLTLNEGDNLRLQVENEDNTRDILVHTANINVLRII